MNVRNFSLVLAVMAMSVSSVSAQDFFWSFENLGGSAVQGDVDANLGVLGSDINVGDQATVYLYYNTANSELDTGAGLNLSFSNNGVLGFVSAETFDFDVELTAVPGTVLGQRWGDASGAAGSVDTNSVTGLNAFTVVAGDGIIDANDGSGPFIDLGYDTSSSSFLFGAVTVEVLGEGTTDVIIEAGDIGIVNAGQTINPTFGQGRFTITVPEPATAGFLALGLVGLVARRRR